MGFDLAKLTVSARRHVSTAFGNKDAFYSETIEIPTDVVVDRSSIYAFVSQRLDLAFLLDCYYSCPASDGTLPNKEVWNHVTSRVSSMNQMFASFPEIIRGILAFDPNTYLSK